VTLSREIDGRIRRGTPDDGAALAAIYDPIVTNTTISFEEVPPGPEGMRERIRAGGDQYPWLVFEREGSVAGYVYASQHRSRAAYRWSVDVSAYVDPSAHRGRIGSRLYAALFEILAAQGYCGAFAGITLPNEASVRLHHAAGFTDVGTYRNVGFKFGRWHDVLWLERRLRPGDGAPSEPLTLAELDWA
jgi:phosphinothricin acetyltransferase